MLQNQVMRRTFRIMPLDANSPFGLFSGSLMFLLKRGPARYTRHLSLIITKSENKTREIVNVPLQKNRDLHMNMQLAFSDVIPVRRRIIAY